MALLCDFWAPLLDFDSWLRCRGMRKVPVARTEKNQIPECLRVVEDLWINLPETVKDHNPLWRDIVGRTWCEWHICRT